MLPSAAKYSVASPRGRPAVEISHAMVPKLDPDTSAKSVVDHRSYFICLVVDLPLWKIWKSIGIIISNIWKNWKNKVPPILTASAVRVVKNSCIGWWNPEIPCLIVKSAFLRPFHSATTQLVHLSTGLPMYPESPSWWLSMRPPDLSPARKKFDLQCILGLRCIKVIPQFVDHKLSDSTHYVSGFHAVVYFGRTWNFIAGWWLTYPSEKYESQLGWLFPIWKNKKCSKPATR